MPVKRKFGENLQPKRIFTRKVCIFRILGEMASEGGIANR